MMQPFLNKIVVLAMALIGLFSGRVGAGDFLEEIQAKIKSDLAQRAAAGVVDGSPVIRQAHEWVLTFYAARNFTPAFYDAAGIRPEVPILIDTIRHADGEGLQKSAYPLGLIDQLMAEAIYRAASGSRLFPQEGAIFDMALTTAFFLHAAYLSEGQLATEAIHENWRFEKPPLDMAGLLENALNENLFESLLKSLAPPHEGYRRLKAAMLTYDTIRQAGGWPAIAGGSKLKKGDQGNRVLDLRRRLIISGDLLAWGTMVDDRFDDVLEAAVRRFQQRHGLAPDGIVGAASLAALNVPVEERLRKIKVNLERFRWLPRFMGQRYIAVNIPAYELEVVENGSVLQRMRVVVGKTERPTPVLAGKITYLELNPYWHIPPTIARTDILPKAQEDPDYLVRQRIRVFENWQDRAAEIDPLTIDWNRIQPAHFPYKLRQEPAPFNSLGRVKFMFPNQMSIYLHDTPARELFHRDARNFSSGCVRLEKPKELADYLLKSDPSWNPEKLNAALQAAQPRIVLLKDPIAVYLLYWTAWVDPDQGLQFREDIYDKDDTLAQALENGLPAAPALATGTFADRMVVSKTLAPADPNRDPNRPPSELPMARSDT
jgi:murein L,D-transpeptidase YcbB/YkuD